MNTSVMIAVFSCIILLTILVLLFFKQVKSLFLLVLNTVFGWVGLYIFNLLFSAAGFFIGINIASASIVGILGLPGLLLLVVLKFIYK